MLACLLITLQLAGLLPSRTVAKKSAKDREHPAPRAAAIAAADVILAPNRPRCRSKRKATDAVDNSQGHSNPANCHQLNMDVVDQLPHHATLENIRSAFNVVCVNIRFIINTDSNT